MSDYFRTLNRMEQEQQPQAEGTSLPLATASQTAGWQRATSPLPMPYRENGQGSFAALFDNLRALANGRPVRSLVLAGASTFEGVRSVSTGIVTQVTRRGLTVLVAKLEETEAQPILRAVGELTATPARAGKAGQKQAVNTNASGAEITDPLSLDLRGGPVPPELEKWLETANASQDLVIIEGPPLGCSLDAAIVGRACDGLAVVVEPEETPEDALQASVERARAVGCRVLGLVMSGTRDYIPRWIRQAVGQSNHRDLA